VLASKLAPHVIALPEPSSVIAIQSVCPAVGVPDRFVVNDVMAVDSAVTEKKSTLSVFIVGSAADATVPARFVIRLFVKVCVFVVPTTAPVAPWVAVTPA
jgi:hypothetical protein